MATADIGTNLSFEDERSIAEKGKWVREQGLGGTLVWTINYGYLPQSGTNPQMQAVKKSVIASSAASYRVYRDGMAIATVTDPDGYRWLLATFRKFVPFVNA